MFLFKDARSFLVFAVIYSRSLAVWNFPLLCKFLFLNALDWLHCLQLQPPSPVCVTPGCVLANGKGTADKNVAVGEQKTHHTETFASFFCWRDFLKCLLCARSVPFRAVPYRTGRQATPFHSNTCSPLMPCGNAGTFCITCSIERHTLFICAYCTNAVLISVIHL